MSSDFYALRVGMIVSDEAIYLGDGIEFLLRIQLDEIPKIRECRGEHITGLVDHRRCLIVAVKPYLMCYEHNCVLSNERKAGCSYLVAAVVAVAAAAAAAG